jgi:hypothetical protein
MAEMTEREVGRLEQKVDTILENQERFMQKHDKLATRIGSVENKIHWYTGGMAVISASFVFMGDQIRKTFLGH